MSDKVELVAPAGSFEKLKYAFAYGADAVYAGVPKFSLRARENEFNEELLREAVNYSHSINKKIYLTMNIFPHNRKIDSFKKSLYWMNQLKPDAIILSDPGIIMLAREICPSIPIHLSTQANTVNWASVKFWQRMGIRRSILSRELSLPEISEIKKKVVDMEIEIFVHGAICIAYSGRCLLSNYFTFRDPNQGTCVNSCRWRYHLYKQGNNGQEHHSPMTGNYYLEEHERPGVLLPIDEDENGTYIMNSKDLCTIELLNKLIDSGVDSFKIEGRTKSIYYLSIVTRAYRNAIDESYKGKSLDQKWRNEVFAVANREYTTGFLVRNPRQDGENYANNHKNTQTHLFCGKVEKIENNSGRVLVSVRNRFQKGDLLEVVSPNDQFYFKAETILSQKGESLKIAHGGGEQVYLMIPDLNNEYALIRKPVQMNDSVSV